MSGVGAWTQSRLGSAVAQARRQVAGASAAAGVTPENPIDGRQDQSSQGAGETATVHHAGHGSNRVTGELGKRDISPGGQFHPQATSRRSM